MLRKKWQKMQNGPQKVRFVQIILNRTWADSYASFFLSKCAKIPARIVPLMEW